MIENPQVFPMPNQIIDANHPNFKLGCKGMQLRDYLAGQALTGQIANINCLPGTTFKRVASLAYQMADAMLKERWE